MGHSSRHQVWPSLLLSEERGMMKVVCSGLQDHQTHGSH